MNEIQLKSQIAFINRYKKIKSIAFKEIVKVYLMCRLAVVGSTGNWGFFAKKLLPGIV